MIRIGCCSFVFGGLDLGESLNLCRTMAFRRVDVSAADIGPKAHVDQQEAASERGAAFGIAERTAGGGIADGPAGARADVHA
jgi:hypothetical protein